MRSKNASVRMVLPAIGVVLAVTSLAGLAFAESPDQATADPAVDSAAASAEREVVLYYFHGARRCNTCLTIESNAQQAIETKFDDELRAGTLRWEVVNTDEPANAHFVEEFSLVSSSLVVVEMKGGDVVRHDVLQEVWTLARDEPRFLQYVQRSVHGYLE